jgi:ParB family chromosome partitioning protein
MLARIQLPALPRSHGLVSASEAARIERSITELLPSITDIPAADEWLRQAAALETYLRGREAQPFMRGAQRRLEARIGQLLGPARIGGDRKSTRFNRNQVEHVPVDPIDCLYRRFFRLFARALNGEIELLDDEWRISRNKLARIIHEKLGHQPAFSSIIKPSDNWNFSTVQYGRIDSEDGHGYIPGDLYANCLWYFTNPGDVVAVPMAGSGQIMRVYEDRTNWARPEPWDLDLRMFDLNPRGLYVKLIKQNDLTVSLPIKHANYIVIDVPYYGIATGQYSDKSHDLANMDEPSWRRAIDAVAMSCSRVQRNGDLCTVISPNHRNVSDRYVFLATTVVRDAFTHNGYELSDLAYASRHIQQAQGVGMANLNNVAKRSRIMLTDISEVMTFCRRK